MTRDPKVMANRTLAFDADGQPNPWYYEMPEPGYNYRLPDILCVLGQRQLGKLERFIDKRRMLAAEYDRLIGQLAPLMRRVPVALHSTHAYHLYPLLIDFERVRHSRAATMAKLRERGIGTQVHYIPVHQQPYYRKRYGALALAGADAYYARCLSLPVFPTMERSDVDRVVSALAELV